MIDNSRYLHWQHIQAELARIELLLRREMRRWALAGQDPTDDYRGMYVSRAEIDQLLCMPPATSWGQNVALAEDEEAAFVDALAEATRRANASTTTLLEQGTIPLLRQLYERFELDTTAQEIFLLCLAPAFDTRYERFYGYLQDNVTRRRPTVRLVLDLLGQPGLGQFDLAPYFSDKSPLFKHRLLQRIVELPPAVPHWINQTLHAEETIVAWLMGYYQPEDELKEHITLQRPDLTEADRLLAADELADLVRLAKEQTRGQSPLFILHGVDRLRQAATARQLAAHLGRLLLVVEAANASDVSTPALQLIRSALRDARLTGAVLFVDGWEGFLDTNHTVAQPILRELYDHPDLIVLAGCVEWQPREVPRQRRLAQLTLENPNYGQRCAIWQLFLKDAGHRGERDIVEHLSGRFSLTSSQIRDAAAAAADQAVLGGRTLTGDDLKAAARAYSNPSLGTLARKITPRYGWPDIILPDDQLAILRELVATVQQRPLVLETWGVGHKLTSSMGITALFAGPPGTGKTMAAEVIARELGLDLYKIDLSSVVSKYIGETEKNLERIFREATSSNAILFFDEADAIFGKRSEVKDAHDRYANIEVSYLLQRMEAYDGVAILATNLRANLDDAFARRLDFSVDFPFPEEADRRRIWRTLFPPNVPQDAELNFDLLARRFDLAGGNIRNIIVNAAYLAANDGGVVTMAHLFHGARREMQKMGRLVNAEDFQIE